MERLAFLDEDDYVEILFFPGGFEFDLLRGDEGGGGFRGDGRDFVEGAQDGGVVEVFSSVFAGFDGGFQVGFGDGAATGGQDHALLWSGTAASVVDLHSLLGGLGPTFVTSYASDIDPSGAIVGYATDANFVSYPVIWSPVPEPSTLVLGIAGAAGLVLVSLRKKFRRT